jgi:signal peptidase I
MEKESTEKNKKQNLTADYTANSLYHNGARCHPLGREVQPLLELRHQTRHILKKVWRIASILIVFSAAAVLLLTLWLPAFQVQRGSMAPALNDGEIVIFITTGRISHGDVVAFYQGNKVLIKRVIAVGGDWITISSDGAVSLNGVPLDEPYADEAGAGEEMSVLVTEGHFFLMGDQRQLSLDSRNEEIGLISQDQIIGKTLLRIWPLNKIGFVH